ncbi:hypothetical protein DW352_07730 [Pseudolabrys taiwanensis]|uniref:Protein rhiA n=1 Tax=Pseudolabrys taiwanensis TaxID=331696 RepID=A0A345ZU17_9HYPH|nr:hypothetical protein [Pseudolabrys taiwanensis]AXK80414.1 hypothetical protein DW352_07730 [Pseudolabrys taiwanensis]
MADEKLSLRFRNRSGAQYDFLCFQHGVSPNTPSIATLAWLVRPLASGVDLDFTWTTNCCFVWFEQGAVTPDITFKAQQSAPADPISANLVTLTSSNGAYQFGPTTGGGAAGVLTIDCDGTIPSGTVMIGIGMSGLGTHAVAAEPNFAAVFTVKPEYWISFGSFTPGQTLDDQALIKATPLAFPPNVTAMTATLDVANKWILQPGLI